MADVAHAEDVIEPEERAFIHSIIDFGDTVVREVMVPRPDMVTTEASLTVSEALRQALSVGYSRLPVYRENIDDVVGIAYAKDLMGRELDGRDAEEMCIRDRLTPAGTSRSASINRMTRPNR